MNNKIVEQIEALPDGSDIMAGGMDIDPLAAVPLFICGIDLKVLAREHGEMQAALRGIAECGMLSHCDICRNVATTLVALTSGKDGDDDKN